ncbi:hypothetical protein CR513_26060, partial [Mucuna pruriens]
MNKIRNGQDNVTWIPANIRVALDQHWGSTDFQNKSSIAKENQAIDKGALAYCGRPISIVSHYEKMVVEKTKKLKTGKWVNDKTRELVVKYQQH